MNNKNGSFDKGTSRAGNGQNVRKARPLDQQRLRDMTLRYVARYATSSAKLRDYLKRKLRERDWQGEDAPDVEGLVGYCLEKGYVDDALYARQKADDLTRRGYGRRRVDTMLFISGITDDDASEARELADAAKWHAALLYARRKRIGPFVRHDKIQLDADPAQKDRQIAAMLRAGHDMDAVRAIINAPDFAQLREKGDEALDEALDRFDQPF